jgi:L-alanine-DL-glutamate epimerase-like enolase superfamily enzyme
MALYDVAAQHAGLSLYKFTLSHFSLTLLASYIRPDYHLGTSKGSPPVFVGPNENKKLE